MLFAIPLGLWMGWVHGAFVTLNPLFQILRPISPIAWIPIAILWFGVGNASPIFLIFIASVFPMIVQTTAGVHTIEKRYLRAAENFGVSRTKLFLQVVFPATLPQIIVGMRIGLGVAWLVVVAAEMIALRSGLGYLIIDSRNAGNRYDLVDRRHDHHRPHRPDARRHHAVAGGHEGRAVALCPLRSKIQVRTSARAFRERQGASAGHRRPRLRGGRRRVRRHRRALGLRQDHADEHHRGLPRARLAAPCTWTAWCATARTARAS